MLRYGLAVVAVGVATVLTHLLIRFGDAGLTPLFFAAVLFCAWYGGIGPGLLATVLSGAGTFYLLMRGRQFSAAAMVDYVPRLLVFCVVSVLTGALHEATRRARVAAESANAAKSQFLAMVSHELRAPLSPVMTATEMLEGDPNLPVDLRGDVRTIRRNVETEIRLIDDLVDLTRLSVGKMSLRQEVIDVHEPLRTAVRVCDTDAQERGQHIVVKLEANPSQVMGDPVRLQQVFWNLLRNAIKFTPDGGQIVVSTTNSNSGNSVEIKIADTGIGIDPQKLASIFEAFEQGGPDIQERFGGLGLGLAICRALVKAHDGAIAVQSDGREKGAALTVRLPVHSASPLTPRASDGTMSGVHESADHSRH